MNYQYEKYLKHIQVFNVRLANENSRPADNTVSSLGPAGFKPLESSNLTHGLGILLTCPHSPCTLLKSPQNVVNKKQCLPKGVDLPKSTKNKEKGEKVGER